MHGRDVNERRSIPAFLMFATAGMPSWGSAAPFQASTHPMGVQAAHIYDLWNVMLGVCTVVFIAVLIGLVVALRRAGRGDETTPADISSFTDPEHVLERNVMISVGISIALLLALLAASVFTDRALARMPLDDALRLTITAHQFWWEVRYEDEPSSRIFTTANELQIPVGRPVLARLQASDVIHSFWVPNLQGKKDLIPGESTTIQFRADQPGVYRGQCAEFCGYQHAWMAFQVTARPAAEFEQWAQAQRQPAPEPTDELARHGRDVFMAGPCAMCHNIQGTDAHGQFAPDLTHVASRPFLAAGRLPNTPSQMMAWIINPQQFKPGVNMPAIPLSPEDLKAVVAYLQTLK
ncbi:MAG TPA: cytochrome c oxidase subunit II [Casimicrobiaceae bacterium]|nr:cytochrome c oxidase subunit II [Casimicrobiaceae bacterium]